MAEKKYAPAFYPPPKGRMRWAERDYVDKAPIFCSTDLRDGNQALAAPMSMADKLGFFQMLVDIGFKEIEVGYPAANDTEFEFVRCLIENNLIPDDVTIQVLTMSREQVIRRTFEALEGAKRAIVHLYIATSPVFRETVLRKSREELLDLALAGAISIRERAGRREGLRFEFSPEHFTATETDFALEVCNRVLAEWQPTAARPAIINLPSTVGLSLPHVYARQVEYMHDNLDFRENVVLSVHTHNDRGSAVADAEMGLLAGAQRVEGTLFGNGERTGNTDLVTLAMNLYSQGVDPGLHFSRMPEIVRQFEEATGMRVYERQPYSGQLVFAAFSGTHQDAIAKGMRQREQAQSIRWQVPYLPVDPKDVGREYEADVIRVNSQSGSGGIGYLLEQKYGLAFPREMRLDFMRAIKAASDREHRELSLADVHAVFQKEFLDVFTPIDVVEAHFAQKDGITAYIDVQVNGGPRRKATATGNGRLDAVSNCLKALFGYQYSIVKYQEHALGHGSDSRAIAYVGIIEYGSGRMSWGAGTHDDIMAASVNALVSALNRLYPNPAEEQEIR